MLGNSSQQPELGHFTLEWALNSSFHWFIRVSWEEETRQMQLNRCLGARRALIPPPAAWY